MWHPDEVQRQPAAAGGSHDFRSLTYVEFGSWAVRRLAARRRLGGHSAGAQPGIKLIRRLSASTRKLGDHLVRWADKIRFAEAGAGDYLMILVPREHEMPPDLEGIHHLKFAVSDLERSLEFYERAFAAERIQAFDHKHPDGQLYAFILSVPGLGTHLELRFNPEQARLQARFDPVTFQVADRKTLEMWREHLLGAAIDCSPVLAGLMSWLTVFEDPDQRRLRLYARVGHGGVEPPSNDTRWLG